MKMKVSALAAALTGVMALGASGQAAANVYAGSALELSNLTIVVVDAQGDVATAGVLQPEFTFNVEDSATLNGSTTAFAASCSSIASNCSAVSPVLKVPVANAPGSTLLRANGDYSLLGPGSGGDYSNANAEIATAQLVQGVPTSTKQVSENEITSGTGAAQASTNIQSNTTLEFSFTLPPVAGTFDASPATMFLNFSANPEMEVLVNNAIGVGVVQANMTATFTLQRNGAVIAVWSPNGVAGDVLCSVACFGEIDPETLNQTLGQGPSNGGSSHSLGTAASAYALTIGGLLAGEYNLTIAGLTSVNVTTVPEPGSLMLLGSAAAAFGLFGVRRRKFSLPA